MAAECSETEGILKLYFNSMEKSEAYVTSDVSWVATKAMRRISIPKAPGSIQINYTLDF